VNHPPTKSFSVFLCLFCYKKHGVLGSIDWNTYGQAGGRASILHSRHVFDDSGVSVRIGVGMFYDYIFASAVHNEYSTGVWASGSGNTQELFAADWEDRQPALL
jgi:hypothetical protein